MVSQLPRLLCVFHRRIAACVRLSSGLSLGTPPSQGEINKYFCGTPQWHYPEWLKINPSNVWGEVWNAKMSRSASFLFSFWGCCRERINLEAVTRKSNVISIRHQIMATTESWNGRSIIYCMDLLFSNALFLHKVNMADSELISAVWFSSLETCVFIHAKGVWQAESRWPSAELIELSILVVLWLQDVESPILTRNG